MTINKNQQQVNQQHRKDENKTGAKRKTKYYNLYGKDGEMNDVVLLKGRVKCECQAAKHKLINNCLKCGRVVCEQEGSGPCLFCGNLVCSQEEQKVIDSQTKKGENLKKSLMERKGLNDALERRDRLLKYDRESEQRTTVIDDESDYFKANSVWLSDEERAKLKTLESQLRDTKHGSRLNRKTTFDFAGRKVIDEEPKELEEEILRQIMEITSKGSHMSSANPDEDLKAPIFIENIPSHFPKLKNSANGFDGIYSRVQDKEFMEMSDQKACLSMHQPWASLLVAGIKRHEGRSWYTGHRGRLWIASTAKPANPDEITELEVFYKNHYKGENLTFPSQYPSGVLLGCVNVTDCLPQEEYRKIYPNGESDSPFVFICHSPQELSIRFPVKGEHKICKFHKSSPKSSILIFFQFIPDKLEQNIHSAALKTLMKCQSKIAPSS